MLLDLEKSPTWKPLPAFKTAPRPFSSTCETRNRLSCLEIVPYAPTRTKLQQQQDQQKRKKAAHAADFQRQLRNYQPENDIKIVGDPSATLFLSRIAYDTTESHITQALAIYGRINTVRVLRGYAFVVYDNAESVSNAIQQTAGSTLLRSHRILLDFERSRKQPNWRPRRLGGGLGGRFSVFRQRQDTSRFHQIQRRGADSLRPGYLPPERRFGVPRHRETGHWHDNRASINRNDDRNETSGSSLRREDRREDRRNSLFTRNGDPSKDSAKDLSKDRKREASGRALRQY